MLRFFSTPKEKLSKILSIIIVVVFALGAIFSTFYIAKKLGLSFLPFSLESSTEKNGLPKTPKGKVAPSSKFLEQIRDQQGRSPDGQEFNGPSSPPPNTDKTIPTPIK